MARQKGIIKLEGTIGDVSFYKSVDGFLAREKGGVDKERIKNDPAFQRTRENGSEFGRAGKSGRVLRTAFRLLLQNSADKKVTSRLTKDMLKVVQSDPTNERGSRSANSGNISLLSGFDFNINGKLSAALFAQYQVSMDRAGGELGISIPQFVPSNSIVGPSGATHFKIVSAGAEIDFDGEIFIVATSSSNEIALNNQIQAPVDLVNNITPNTGEDLFMVLGIEFMQQVNGIMYPLKNGSYNPLAIVFIDRP
jgi:hypothetical protein